MQIHIRDDQAAASLVHFAMDHRTRIAEWALKQFEVAPSDNERASLAVEVFEKFVAAVEDLEMLFFAMQEKGKTPGASFFSIYAGMFVREEGRSGQEKPESAGEILRQLNSMDQEGFRQALSLPTVDEYHQIYKQGQGERAAAETEYLKYLGDVRDRMVQAVQNRANPEIMDTYNKIKHGFVVMRDPNRPGVFMVQKVTSLDGRNSVVEGRPYAPTRERLAELVDNTRLVGRLGRELLMLHFRATQ